MAATTTPAIAQPEVPGAIPPPATVGAVSTASLYVGELEPSVTEAMLFEMFNIIGPVSSVRVCRDAVTRRSLGYAYVNFHNVNDGERALESLNYTPIKGRPCRIMWSQRDPSLRKSGTGNIFIKNLDPAIDNKALHDTFCAFGNILSCKVAIDLDGNSRGYGFVHYETSDAADAAIQAVNGMLLNDKKVFVGHHVPRREREATLAVYRSRFTNLFVKNLPESVTESSLRKLFVPFGQITSCVLSVDENGKSRCFGFVNFDHHDSAHAAVDSLHETEVDGKNIYVQRAQKKSEREEELRRQYNQQRSERIQKWQGTNLYIKNVDDAIDDDQLRQEFGVYGVITSAKIMRDDKGNSKGFGFVCFSSPDEATKAVTEMNGKMLNNKPIYVALAQRKEQRRQQLEAQHTQRSHFRIQPGQPMIPSVAGGMYPGGPVFYAPQTSMPQQRGFFPVGPTNMGPRPRWQQPGQPGNPQAPGVSGYHMGQQFPSQVPVNQPTGPRGPRQQRNSQGASTGTRPAAQRPAPTAGPTVVPINANAPPAQRPSQAGRPNSQFKYTSNARNTPAAATTTTSATAATLQPQLTLTPSALASAPPEQQKRMLGEAIFPLVNALEQELAPKITGMLLEMDNAELLHLMENPEAFNAKVVEASSMLKEHMGQ